MRVSRGPLLVTGMPRSGTTWVARELAQSPGAALAGREPMNPRPGQHALGGTLTSWAKLEAASAHQTRLLRMAYAGWDPRVYSRYGHRQWMAPLPRTRVIVKDPFALLSIATVVRTTGALPVIVYRHPGAVLASFRRMNWSPDPADVHAVESLMPGRNSGGDGPSSTAASELNAEVDLIARMWSALYGAFLNDATSLDRALIVSHGELTVGGEPAMQQLRAACGLIRPRQVRTRRRKVSRRNPDRALHNFDRLPQHVASQWRSQVQADELAHLETSVYPVWTRLEHLKLSLDDPAEPMQ